MQKAFGVTQHVRVLGQRACFTGLESKTERFSSVVGSVSAWNGMLSQVMGHKGSRYEIFSVALLFNPRHTTQTVNEIRDFGNGTRGPINTEKQRTLRTTAYLAGNQRVIKTLSFEGELIEKKFAGVEFIVTFRLTVNDSTQLGKLANMLKSRLRNGHFYGTPYLGQIHLIANVEPVQSFADLHYPELDIIEGDEDHRQIKRVPMPLFEHSSGLKTVDYNADLGLSFYGIDWEDPTHPHYFAPLRVEHGIVTYPDWAFVRKLGIRREGTRC